MELNFGTGPELPETTKQVWQALYKGPLPQDWRRRYQAKRLRLVGDEFQLARNCIAGWVQHRAFEDRTDYLVDFSVMPFAESGTYCYYRALLDPREQQDQPAHMYWRVYDTATMLWVTPGLIHSLGRTVCSAGADDPERPTIAAPVPRPTELMEPA